MFLLKDPLVSEVSNHEHVLHIFQIIYIHVPAMDDFSTNFNT